MKKNNRFIFIITCLLITTINCSSLFGTAGFNRQLNVFVNENNLSHEDIQWILSELNQIEYMKYFTEYAEGNVEIHDIRDSDILAVQTSKMKENILKLRE